MLTTFQRSSPERSLSTFIQEPAIPRSALGFLRIEPPSPMSPHDLAAAFQSDSTQKPMGGNRVDNRTHQALQKDEGNYLCKGKLCCAVRAGVANCDG